MNIGIIGMGAVGMFIAHRLSSQGFAVTGYVRRNDQKTDLDRHGIHMMDEVVRIPIELFDKLSAHDVFVIATKKNDNDQLYQTFKKKFPSSQLLFVQNGMADEVELNGLDQAVFMAIFDHGITRHGNYRIEQKGFGKMVIGSWSDDHRNQAEQLVEELNHHQFPVYFDSDVMIRKKEKLVINCVINPLTAICDIKNGEILNNDYLKEVAEKLNLEACRVLGLPANELWIKIEEVCEKTAENTSSMLADLQNGKPTEIDHLNGYLVAKDAHRTPTHQIIQLFVKSKEKNRGIRN